MSERTDEQFKADCDALAKRINEMLDGNLVVTAVTSFAGNKKSPAEAGAALFNFKFGSFR